MPSSGEYDHLRGKLAEAEKENEAVENEVIQMEVRGECKDEYINPLTFILVAI